ncbi:hypothetical protein CR162_08455 [Pseudoroseomonas rhizosphaerae]|uniref:DUF5648 domain-containing protein n=1 Tax=Teichococcus rhizosphaerae TaxID=1335062 RepID=A0A2C7AEK2_9PROT|nr:hypothetical protein [Pseudoroseomonas rhizosphaerae]PHK95504.1 hypothetical protein CR162_08455 [Pseudoroseomonas rhizosphaerae]
MSKIFLTSPSSPSYGVLNGTEGDKFVISVFRDDFSADQEFEIRWRQIHDWATPDAITNYDFRAPLKVRFAAGDNQPQIIELQALDDRVAKSYGEILNFDIVPGAGTSRDSFDVFGYPTDPNYPAYFQISIAENDSPNVRATLLSGQPGDSAVYANEGGQIRWQFDRTEAWERMEVFFQPGAEHEGFAREYLGYDPANPFKVVWEAGDASSKFLTIDVPDDDIAGPGPDYIAWYLRPGQNVTGITGPELTYTSADGNGGTLFPVAYHDNENLPTLSLGAREWTVEEGADQKISFEVFRSNTQAPGVESTKVWIKLDTADTARNPLSRYGASDDLIELSFGYGEKSRPIELALPDDATHQGTQTLTATIVKATTFWYNGEVADAAPPGVGSSAALTVQDNDPAPPEPEGPVAYPTVAAHRFWNTENGTHFYTPSVAERDNVIATLPAYRYEGVGFQTLTASTPGAEQMWRFYNSSVGYHFFTISEDERDSIIARLPEYRFEGVGFHAAATGGEGMTAVHRFFNTQTGSHFFTASAEEKDAVIQTLPGFQYEGVAFHTPVGDSVWA